MESQTLHVPSGYNQHDIFRLTRRDVENPSPIYQHSQPLDVTIYCSRYAAGLQSGEDQFLRQEHTPTYVESVLSRHPQTPSETTIPFYRSSDLNCSYGSYESLSSVDEIVFPKNTEINFNPELCTFPKYDIQSDSQGMEDLLTSRDTHSTFIPNTVTCDENRFPPSFLYPTSSNLTTPSGNYPNKAVVFLTDQKQAFPYTPETRFKLNSHCSSPVFDPDSDCTAKSDELIPDLTQHNDTNITDGIEPPTSGSDLDLFKDNAISTGNCAESLSKDAKQNANNSNDGGENDKQLTVKSASSENVKPALSYIALIATAILESTQQRLSLGSIYSWIETNYPFYRNRSQGWRNSVRHNLSLNDCFVKAGRCEDGKGNYWAIHPANVQDFMRGDFRQRRRSRRRGRKASCDINVYPMSAKYLTNHSSLTMSPFAPNLNPIYSPYTEAERQAYRLDEALLRQTINSPFVKWFHGSMPHASFSTGGTDYKTPSAHWQTYSDKASPSTHQLGHNFSR
ncbi:uncharacterized protein LOC106871145 [Octopus bimaculoides]|uniref:Fork-head domain-containing protein n=1 Tax=Octopus bimaculoides TaxID=37653 RepID=A0A0L8HEK1_OCTBM|nr:uncharacterized protein LOC106871145 [Octopus bimaculoides]|eukprot:XP_014772941.1 PREDICTED: uncharacterized protein LOC106871145 [Octopus bimaculoides]